jgi:hypothetical protein
MMPAPHRSTGATTRESVEHVRRLAGAWRVFGVGMSYVRSEGLPENARVAFTGEGKWK